MSTAQECNGRAKKGGEKLRLNTFQSQCHHPRMILGLSEKQQTYAYSFFTHRNALFITVFQH
jgi:hypothetical protein